MDAEFERLAEAMGEAAVAHGLDSPEHSRAREELYALVDRRAEEVVRATWPDGVPTSVTMGMRRQRCDTCGYTDPDSSMPGHFTCRRRAPVILPAAHERAGKGAEAHATWPGVGPGDWCGEWKPKGEDGR